jgi:hypothetical protein
MVNLPSNTPKDILVFCIECKSNEDAVNILKSNTKLFIQFFDTVCKDVGWVKSNEDLTNRMATHLNKLSQEGKLDLTQTRSIRSTVQLASQRFQTPNFKALSTEIIDEDVALMIDGKPIMMNHSLLAAASPVFERMLKGGFKESTIKKFPIEEIDFQTMNALKDYIETGSISSMDPEAVMNLLFACEKFDLPKLAQLLSEKFLTTDNLMDFVELGNKNRWPGVRDDCFRFIEKNFEGVKLSAQGFKDLHIKIEGNAESLRELSPFLEYYNPDKKEPNVPKDFHLTIKLGISVFPREIENVQKAAVEIFKHFAFARAIDFSEAAPLSDGVLFAIGMHCPKLESINLKGGKFITDAGMGFLATKCPQMKSFNLQGCKSLTNHTLERIAKEYHSNLLELNVEGCPKIDETGLMAAASVCKNLLKLNLGNNGLITPNFFELMAQNLKKIEALKIGGNSFTEHLIAEDVLNTRIHILSLPALKKLTIDDVYLSNDFLKQIAKNHKDIQELQFLMNPVKFGSDWDLKAGFAVIAKECKTLSVLEFDSKNDEISSHPDRHELNLDKDDVSTLISNNPQLQRFKLGTALEEEHIQLLASTCPHLKSISLIRSSNISEQAFLELSEQCPDIEHFELGWEYELSSNTFIQMVNNWTKLNSLSLVICRKITPQAIEYVIQNRPLVRLELMPGEEAFEVSDYDPIPTPLFNTKTLEMLPACCPKLKKLFVDRRYDRANTTPALVAIAKNCQHLEEFYLNVNELDPKIIDVLLTNNPKLSLLGLGRTMFDSQSPQPLIRGLDKKLLGEHPSLDGLMIREPYVVEDIGTEDAAGIENVSIKITGGAHFIM